MPLGLWPARPQRPFPYLRPSRQNFALTSLRPSIWYVLPVGGVAHPGTDDLKFTPTISHKFLCQRLVSSNLRGKTHPETYGRVEFLRLKPESATNHLYFWCSTMLRTRADRIALPVTESRDLSANSNLQLLLLLEFVSLNN